MAGKLQLQLQSIVQQYHVHGRHQLSLRNYLFRPDQFFLALHADPRAGWSILIFLTLAILFGIELALIARYARGQIRVAASTGRMADVFRFAVPSIGILAACTFLNSVVLTLIGKSSDFGWLCSLGVYSLLPLCAIVLIEGVTDQYWFACQLHKVAAIAVSIWTTTLVCTAFRVDKSLSWWHIILLVAPYLILIWLPAIAILVHPPRFVRACLCWKKIRGERVILFYPRELAASEIARLAPVLDEALQFVIEWSCLPGPKYMVPVFMFADAASLKRHLDRTESATAIDGITHSRAISVAYSDKNEVRQTTVHEFAHLVLFACGGLNVPDLLHEAFACFAESTLCGTMWQYDPLPISWRTMSRDSIFRNYRHSDSPEYDNHQCYGYACSIADHLISRYGVEKYVELCRTAQFDTEHSAGAKLAEATQRVYGRSIEELEAEWRQGLKTSVA